MSNSRRVSASASFFFPYSSWFIVGLVTLMVAGLLSGSAFGQTLYNGITPGQLPPPATPSQNDAVPSYITNPPTVIPITVGRQLFVDDFLIQQSTGLTRTPHQPIPFAGNPILVPDPQIDNGFAMPFSDGVWFDPADRLFKMWFFCAATCYAYSTDGKNWIRPSFGDAIVPNTDEVLPGGTLTVWMDLQETNPLHRFKAFNYNPFQPSPVVLYFSADGIHWTGTLGTDYPIPLVFDRTTFFWNPFRNVWVDSMKNYATLPAGSTRPSYVTRFRNYAESPDLKNWTLAGPSGLTSPTTFANLSDPAMLNNSFWAGPTVDDPPYSPGGNFPQLYNVDAVGYESLMVGLFSWYYPGPAAGVTDDPNQLAGPDIVELGVGFSRDGFQWFRPTRGSGPGSGGAFIPASNQPGTWNMGNTQSAGGGFLVVGDKLYFYYSGRTAPHSDPFALGSTGLATLRRDGFYSMDTANGGTGTLTTRPVQFARNTLFVNVSIPQGSLSVQVLDAATGTVLATSNALTNVDSTLQQVNWANGLNDLSSFAARSVQFRFTLTNGELYSFWVSDSTGASNGYMAANGPGFTGPIDNQGSAAYHSVLVRPGSVTLSAGQTQQFTENILGSVNQTVNWSLQPNVGTISSNGLYTAPASIAGAQTVSVIATSVSNATVLGTATVNLSPTTGVSFAGTDTATSGNWQGVYGADGYVLANSTACQSIPAYATFGVQNESMLVWAATTSDPRALHNPPACGGGASAEAWYSNVSPSIFTFNINLATGTSHQVAIYFLDWDGFQNAVPRAELVQVLDARTNVVLDSRVVSNFAGGTYLVWNIAGNVTINVTSIVGDNNAVVSGVFFGGNGSGSGREIVSVSPPGSILIAGGSEQLTATISGTSNTNQTISWSLNPNIGTISTGGVYTAPSTIGTSENVLVSAMDQDAVSGTATINLSASTTSLATASFVKQDATAQGTWLGIYGSDGYTLASGTSQNVQALPSYAALSMQGQQNFLWASSTLDQRGLQLPSGTGAYAATWYGAYDLSFDVNFSDGHSHQFALYALDWDHLGRSESIQIVDAATNEPLDTRTISDFGDGLYLVWNISGHVKLYVTSNLQTNVVISGLFFGSGGAYPESVTISPATSTVIPGSTKQFAATISGTNKQSQNVSWSVSPNVGAISSTGLYTAPAQVAVAQTLIVTGADQDGVNGIATINLNAGNASSGPAVSFINADTSTGGNWQPTYGTDGYALANSVQSIPGYVSFALQNQANYTWIGSTSDPRALQLPGGGGGIASTWYSSGTFNISLSFTDGKSHQVALYAVDWDVKARNETIKIVDPLNPANALDTRTISSFANGIYLVWNISGSVLIQVTNNGGVNSVVSGIFFSSTSGSGPQTTPPQITSANNASFRAGTASTFTMTASGNPSPTLSESGLLPNGVTFNPSTGVLSGTPASGTAGTYTVTFFASNGVAPNASQSFQLNVTAALTNSATAAFLRADTATEGNWMGMYGLDGYDIPNGPQFPAAGQLSYGTYAVQSQSNYTWENSTKDVRALQTDAQGDRAAATWYSGTAFTFDVNLTGLHQVALYILDWDNNSRNETVQITDAANPGTILDTRSIPNINSGTSTTNLANGAYLLWNISGHVTITVTRNGGPNAVIAGIFFGASNLTPPSVTSANNATFTASTAGTFTVTASGVPTPTLSVTGALPSGVTFADNGNGSGKLSGTPFVTAGGQQFNLTFTASNGISPNATQSFTLSVNPAPPLPNSATWVRSDIQTEGNWHNAYGTQGYVLAGNGQNIQSLPPLVTLGMQNQGSWAWATNTGDTRALTIDTAGDRMAACWFGGNFTFSLNLGDNEVHHVALYLLDWDSQSRTETVTITDPATGNVLDTRNIPNPNSNTSSANFVNGTYLIWTASGKINITITSNSGPNAVVSGVFLDP